MGFLSKLFGGDKEAEKTAKDILNGLFGAQNNKEDAPAKPAEGADDSEPDATSSQTAKADGEYSFYDNVPDEENQYNFNGPFTAYFENIFNNDFSEYRYEKGNADSMKRVPYTFYSGGQKVLVVELYAGESKKLKKECAKANVPYLRFYHDHDGWWNTRKYVVERMRKALGRL